MKQLQKLLEEHRRCAIKFTTEPSPVDMEWSRYLDQAERDIKNHVRKLVSEARTIPVQNNWILWKMVAYSQSKRNEEVDPDAPRK
jgi:hypothetical protein